MVPPARRCAAIPRSGPSRGRRRDRSPRRARPAGRGRRRPSPPSAGAVHGGSQPAARTRAATSRSWRARWANPRRSRPVARWPSGSSTSSTLSPAAAASWVMRTSHPKPAATGKVARRAAGDSARWPESGSRSFAPGAQAEQLVGGALDDPEPPALPPGEGGDGKVGLGVEERAEVTGQVGVAEQQWAGARRALAEGQRLPLASPRQPQDAGACRLGDDYRVVARPVVGDDHLRVRKPFAECGHRRADPLLLVPGSDEDGQPVSHRPGRRPGSAGGRRRARSSSPRIARGQRRPGAAPAPAAPPASRRRPPWRDPAWRTVRPPTSRPAASSRHRPPARPAQPSPA